MRVEGAPYPLGAPPTSWAPRVPSGLRVLARYVFWSVKIHYIYSRRLWLSYHANLPCFCSEPLLLQTRARCLPKIRRERATWLIISQTQKHMGCGTLWLDHGGRRRLWSERKGRDKFRWRGSTTTSNLGTCMWSSKSQAFLTKQRNLRSSLSLFVSCRKTNKNYVKRY